MSRRSSETRSTATGAPASSVDELLEHRPNEHEQAVAPGEIPLAWRWRLGGRVWQSITDRPAPYAMAIALGVWSLLSLSLPPRILPSPAEFVAAAVYNIQIGTLPIYIGNSLAVLTLGAAFGITVGIPLGFLIGSTRIGSRMLTPFVGFLYAISGIAWIPVFIIWFGFTRTTVIAVVNYSLIFPVIYNTALGVRSITPVYRQVALTLGAGRLRIIRDVLFPGALPNMATGVRIGVAYGWRGLIAGEMLIAAPGIGYMLFDARAARDTASIIVGMFAIGISWLIMDRVFLRPIETQTVERWGLVEGGHGSR